MSEVNDKYTTETPEVISASKEHEQPVSIVHR